MGYDQLRRSESNGKVTKSGRVKVTIDVPVEVTDFHGVEVTDEMVESEAIAAIQEGKGRVEQIE